MADSREVRKRYCRGTFRGRPCDEVQVLLGDEQAHACHRCGSSQFGGHPRNHVSLFAWPYCLNYDDYVFLRVQGIDPQLKEPPDEPI